MLGTEYASHDLTDATQPQHQDARRGYKGTPWSLLRIIPQKGQASLLGNRLVSSKLTYLRNQDSLLTCVQRCGISTDPTRKESRSASRSSIYRHATSIFTPFDEERDPLWAASQARPMPIRALRQSRWDMPRATPMEEGLTPRVTREVITHTEVMVGEEATAAVVAVVEIK